MSRGPGRKALHTVCMGDEGEALVYCCSVSLDDGVVVGEDGSDLAAVPLRRQRVSSAIPRLDYYYTVPGGSSSSSSSSPAAASTTVIGLVGQNHENIVTSVLYREPEQLPPPPPPRRCSLLFGAFGSVYALAMPVSDDVDSAPPSLYIDSPAAAGGWGESVPLPFETRCCTAEPPTVGYAEIEPHHLILFCVSHHQLHEFHIFHVLSKRWEKPLAVVHPSYKPDPKLEDLYTCRPPHRPVRCCPTVPFIQRAAFVSGSGGGMICGMHSSGSLVIYRLSPLPPPLANSGTSSFLLQLLLHSSLETLNPHLPVSTFGQPFPSFFPIGSPLPGTPSRAITCLGDNIFSLVETTYELFPPDNFVPIYFTTFTLEVDQLPPCIKPLHSTFRLARGGGGGDLRILGAYPSSYEALAAATTSSRDQELFDYYYSKLDAEFFKLFCLRPEKSDYTRCLYSRFKDRLEARSLSDDVDGNVKRFLQFMSSDAVDPFVFVGPDRDLSHHHHPIPRLNTDHLYLVATFATCGCSAVYKLKILDDRRTVSPHTVLQGGLYTNASIPNFSTARSDDTLFLFSHRSYFVANCYCLDLADPLRIQTTPAPCAKARPPFAAIAYPGSVFYFLSGCPPDKPKISGPYSCGPLSFEEEPEPLASAPSPLEFRTLLWYAVVDEHILFSMEGCDSLLHFLAYNVTSNKWTTALADERITKDLDCSGLGGQSVYVDEKIYAYSVKLQRVFQFGVTKSGDSLHLSLKQKLDLAGVSPLRPKTGVSFSGSMTYLGDMVFCAIYSDGCVENFQYASVTAFSIVDDVLKVLHSRVCVLDTLGLGMAEVNYCCSL